MRHLLYAVGWHDYTMWIMHAPPCAAGSNLDHYIRCCRRHGCGGGSHFRRHRLKERT